MGKKAFVVAVLALLVLVGSASAQIAENARTQAPEESKTQEAPEKPESFWSDFEAWRASYEEQKRQEALREAAVDASVEALAHYVAGVEQRRRELAAEKAVRDAQAIEHARNMAARKAWAWQQQLWLWEAQRRHQTQQQYQQQLLQHLRSRNAQRQWFQRDLVRAIEGLAPPANCWYSYVQHRYVCY